MGSIGIAIPGGKFRLEDKNKDEIKEPNTVGELVYQGENVTMGYAESYFDLQKGDENDGLLHTGDLGMRDEDGFYYITGRLNRFLKMYGNRINLDEIEDILRQAGIENVCTGTDDNLSIYLTDPDYKEDRIVNYIKKNIGINLNSISLSYIEKIPRNNSGKVQYTALE